MTHRLLIVALCLALASTGCSESGSSRDVEVVPPELVRTRLARVQEDEEGEGPATITPAPPATTPVAGAEAAPEPDAPAQVSSPELSPPVVEDEASAAPPAPRTELPEVVESVPVYINEDAPPAAAVVPPAAEPLAEGEGFALLGSRVAAGTSTRLAWSARQTFAGIANPTPVLVVNGAEPGPVLCLTAAVHGDELNGIEIVRRVVHDLDPTKLTGVVIGVPIVNMQGFHRTSRYLSDRRDLNRYFPGNPNGSLASRIAYSFFEKIVRHCDALVDLHTGSFHRTNLPQLRADLTKEGVVELTEGFGSTVILHSVGTEGTLRRSAVMAGIPAVTLEAGAPMRVQEEQVEHGVKGIQTLLTELGMYRKRSIWGNPQPVYYKSTWVRADRGGILFTKVELGERVEVGDLLGTVTDPITNNRSEIISPNSGRVLGMALNQVVMPGFAAFRIGIQASEAEVSDPESLPEEAPLEAGDDRVATPVDPSVGDEDLHPVAAFGERGPTAVVL